MKSCGPKIARTAGERGGCPVEIAAFCETQWQGHRRVAEGDSVWGSSIGEQKRWMPAARHGARNGKAIA